MNGGAQGARALHFLTNTYLKCPLSAYLFPFFAGKCTLDCTPSPLSECFLHPAPIHYLMCILASAFHGKLFVVFLVYMRHEGRVCVMKHSRDACMIHAERDQVNCYNCSFSLSLTARKIICRLYRLCFVHVWGLAFFIICRTRMQIHEFLAAWLHKHFCLNRMLNK